MKLRQFCSNYQHDLLTWRLFVSISMVLLSGVAGCSSSNRSYYADSENALDTSGYYDLLDHISNYYPSGVALNFPGYIVSFEETSRSLVTNDRDDVLLDKTVASSGHTVERLLKSLRYNVPFVSQVMRYEGQTYGEGNCALYSLYHSFDSVAVNPCNDDPRNSTAENYDYGFTFERSWNAMDILNSASRRNHGHRQATHRFRDGLLLLIAKSLPIIIFYFH